MTNYFDCVNIFLDGKENKMACVYWHCLHCGELFRYHEIKHTGRSALEECPECKTDGDLFCEWDEENDHPDLNIDSVLDFASRYLENITFYKIRNKVLYLYYAIWNGVN